MCGKMAKRCRFISLLLVYNIEKYNFTAKWLFYDVKSFYAIGKRRKSYSSYFFGVTNMFYLKLDWVYKNIFVTMKKIIFIGLTPGCQIS